MYREYANGTHRNYNGARLGRAHRISAWELAEMQRSNDDSRSWEERAHRAHMAMLMDVSIDDGFFNDFNDRVNLIANSLSWKQIFYVWRVAHLTIRLQPSLSVVDLAREAGLVA